MIVAVVITIKAIANWPEKDFGTSTGFEPAVASTLALQCSTNWATKTQTWRAGQFAELI